MDYNFTISEYSGSETYQKHGIVYVLSGSERIYYYSLVDNNINNTPASSPTFWTTSFYWQPNYASTVDLMQKRTEIQFGDGYSQRMRNGINTAPLEFNLSFENRSDAESTALLHFVEQKGGVDPFVYNPSTIFNKTGLKYIAIDPRLTYSSYNNNSLSVKLQRVFDP
jgi:phage-related protein